MADHIITNDTPRFSNAEILGINFDFIYLRHLELLTFVANMVDYGRNDEW